MTSVTFGVIIIVKKWHKATRTTKGVVAMTKHETHYTIYMQRVTYAGGEHTSSYGDDCFDELAKEYKTLDEAVEAVKAYLASDSVEVHDTKHGFGSVTFTRYQIERFAYDEEEGWFLCDENGNPTDDAAYLLDGLDTRPEINAAWNKAQKSYWNWLDYKQDWFYTLKELLDEE